MVLPFGCICQPTWLFDRLFLYILSQLAGFFFFLPQNVVDVSVPLRSNPVCSEQKKTQLPSAKLKNRLRHILLKFNNVLSTKLKMLGMFSKLRNEGAKVLRSLHYRAR